MENTNSPESRLPPIDVSFWIMIITATTLGETAGDLLSMTMKLGYLVSSLILVGLFVVALLFQLAAKRRHDALFWTVIVLTSTAGTTLSDYVNRSLGLGYAKGTLLLLALLTAVFVGWRTSARSLSINSIKSVRTEALYWAAILISSTLGTALGDFLADDAGLGFGGGTLVLAGLLAGITLAALFTDLSPVLLFWLGIVVTHPIGATMGDYLTKPEGFGMGPLPATGLLLVLFAVTSILVHRRAKTLNA